MGIKGEKTRQKILKAAAKVFAAKGLSGASMSQIAGEAKLVKSHIYLYFDSKEKLYHAVLGGFMAELDKIAQQREIFVTAGNPPEQRIRNLLRFYLDFLCRNRLFAAISRWDMTSGNYYTMVNEKGDYISIFKILNQIICEGQANGVFCRSISPNMAIYIINHLCLLPYPGNGVQELTGDKLSASTQIQLNKSTLYKLVTELCIILLMRDWIK